MVEYAALEGTILYQKRELDRQSARIKGLTIKLDEVISATNAMQEILNGAKRISFDKKDWLRFQARPIVQASNDENGELGI